MMQIALQPAEENSAALAQLMSAYLHELAAVSPAAGAPEAQLAALLGEPGARAFLICADARLAGFAIASRRSRSPAADGAYAVRAFFIARELRRAGVGSAAAGLLFAQLPGRWELATYAMNVPASAFWRSVAQSYTGGRYRESWHQDAGWRGSVQTFTAPPDA